MQKIVRRICTLDLSVMAIVVCWQLSPKFIVQIFLPSGTETNKDISNKCSEELLAYRIYRVFRKNCVFPNPLQPIPRLHIAERDFRSNESVSLIGWPYFVQPITAQCWLGRSLKIQKILGEKHIFFRTPCTFGRRTTRKVISRDVSRLINRVFPTIGCSMIIARSALSHKSYITFLTLQFVPKRLQRQSNPWQHD